MSFEIKSVNGKNLLYVMALDHEYGVHLTSRFTPLLTGVGPIEAAIGLTRALFQLSQRDELPDLVVSLGSGGSNTLGQTQVYQASHVSYRDLDASALGFEKGTTPFLDHPAQVGLPHTIPNIPSARLSTGANVVSGTDYDLIDADMVDMESFATWRVCDGFGIPLIALRGISDGKIDLKELRDWTQYLHIIDEKLAHAVDQLENAIISKHIRL